MSLPHRIGAAYCQIGKVDDPEEKRQPGHKIGPANKANSNAGKKNEGDETSPQENYGGGSNAYFTEYPNFLVAKVKGSITSATQIMEVIEVELEPDSNTSESRVIDNRSVPDFYDSNTTTLGEATAGKGEIIEWVETHFWSETTEDPDSPLFGLEYPTLYPVTDQDNNAYDEKIFWPTQRFMPWDNTGILSTIAGYQNKADYLCSLRIPYCDINDLWVRREPPNMIEDPPNSGQYFPQYVYESWTPLAEYPEEKYASYFNTSSWSIWIKTHLCCWNKGITLRGIIKIGKRFLKFDPQYIDANNKIWFNGALNGIYPVPYFIGNRFVIDDNFAPDNDFQTIPWEVVIDVTNATGEWFQIKEFDIPTSLAGSAFEVTYICGFRIDEVIPAPADTV